MFYLKNVINFSQSLEKKLKSFLKVEKDLIKNAQNVLICLYFQVLRSNLEYN